MKDFKITALAFAVICAMTMTAIPGMEVRADSPSADSIEEQQDKAKEDSPVELAGRDEDTGAPAEPVTVQKDGASTDTSEVSSRAGAGEVYRVSGETDYEKALEQIQSAEADEAVILFAADYPGDAVPDVLGVEGKHVTVQSETDGFKVNVSGTLKGDLTLDNVSLRYSSRNLYAAGHLFETTESFAGSFSSLYGGGKKGEDVQGDTNLVLRGELKVSDLYGGGLDSAVSGSTNILVDDPDVLIFDLFGGGYAEDTRSGTVGGDVNVHIRRGVVQSPIAGGNNQASMDDAEDRAPAAVAGTVNYTVGEEGLPKDSAVSGSAMYTYGGSLHSTVGNIHLRFLEGGTPAGDVYGCGYADTVTGTVKMEFLGAHMDQGVNIFGGGEDHYDHPNGALGAIRILNQGKAEQALEIYYDCEDDEASYEGLFHCIFAGGNYHGETFIEGNVLLDVAHGKLDCVSLDTDAPNNKNHINGDSAVKIHDGAEIMRVTANEECYDKECHTMDVIVSGGNEKEPMHLGQLNYFTNAMVTSGSYLKLDFKNYDFRGRQDKPFINISHLTVEKDAYLLTENNTQARILSRVDLMGTWDQRNVSGDPMLGDADRSKADLRVGGSFYLDGGTLISRGTSHIYNNVSAEGGTMVLMDPAIFSMTSTSREAALDETDLYLPVIEGDDENYPQEQIRLSCGSDITGNANVYLYAEDSDWQTDAEITDANLWQNYINGRKEMSSLYARLANPGAREDGYYFAREADEEKTDSADEDYDMWQIQKRTVLTTYPEDQTIYTGGADGSEANAEFPHPIYVVSDPEGNRDILTEDAGFLVNGVNYEGCPFTVKYYETGEDGQAGAEITDDQRYGDYIARIVLAEDVDPNADVTTADDKLLLFQDGNLRIRFVSSITEASGNELTTEAVSYDATDEGAKAEAMARAEAAAAEKQTAAAILPADTTILLNGNKAYPYPADAEDQIALFCDGLLPAADGADSSQRETMLLEKAQASGIATEGYESQFRYLDLVDMNNSNAWVASTSGTDVFWPYPDGADKNSEIQLVHFTDLHREYAMNGSASLEDQVAASTAEPVAFDKTEAGIWFHIPQSGFSPFGLLWKNSYGVTYAFASGTADMPDLPESVLALLPKDENTYAAGETVTAIAPAQTEVADGDGVWTFRGWDQETAEMTDAGVTFTGTWEYTKNSYGVTYTFVSGTQVNPDLPESVLALLPKDENTYAAGETVTAIAPAQTEVADGDGVWTFQGWDKDQKPSAAGLTFTGVWTFEANETPLNLIPVITAGDRTLAVGDPFDPLQDVTAWDEEDGDVTANIVVLENAVDTATPGVYEVTYKVTDSQNAYSIKTILVTVVEPDEPDIPDTPDTPDEPDTPDTPDTPGTPDKPDTPEDLEQPAGTAVRTGDASCAGLWTLTGMASLAALLAVWRKRKTDHQ